MVGADGGEHEQAGEQDEGAGERQGRHGEGQSEGTVYCCTQNSQLLGGRVGLMLAPVAEATETPIVPGPASSGV
jgi:hypothetical protein